MTPLRTVQTIIDSVPPKSKPERLAAPAYTAGPDKGFLIDNRPRIGLAVESMKRHTSDEGWQIFAGLEHAGWQLAGHRLPINSVMVYEILKSHNPGVVLVQDEREWDTAPRDFRDVQARFFGTHELAARPDVFKLTILKDSHQRPEYHRDSAARMGCHAWIHYYHPKLVSHFATYVRPEHLIRTWHSIEPSLVPAWDSTHHENRCFLSGALSGVYPLRQRLFRDWKQINGCWIFRHPGYHMRGCCTPEYLLQLSRCKVAICTSSIYGYALRKIIEATACGCVVITDLPTDEVMPEIDGNLVRVSPDVPTSEVNALVSSLYREWRLDRQREFSEKAKAWYNWRKVGERLNADIETMRRNYAAAG